MNLKYFNILYNIITNKVNKLTSYVADNKLHLQITNPDGSQTNEVYDFPFHLTHMPLSVQDIMNYNSLQESYEGEKNKPWFKELSSVLFPYVITFEADLTDEEVKKLQDSGVRIQRIDEEEFQQIIKLPELNEFMKNTFYTAINNKKAPV